MKGLVGCMLFAASVLSSSIPRTRDNDRLLVVQQLGQELSLLVEEEACNATLVNDVFTYSKEGDFDHMLDVIYEIFHHVLTTCPERAKTFAAIFEQIFTLTSDFYFLSPSFPSKFPMRKSHPVALILDDLWDQVALRFRFVRAEVYLATNMIWFAVHSHVPGLVMRAAKNLNFFIGGSSWRYSSMIIYEIPQLWKTSNFQVALIPIYDPSSHFWGTQSEIDAFSFFKESLANITATTTLGEDFIFPAFFEIGVFLGARIPQFAIDKMRKVRNSARPVWDEVIVLVTNFWMYRKHYALIQRVCPRILDMTHSFVDDLGTPQIEDISLWLPLEFDKCAVVLNLVDRKHLADARDFAIHSVTSGFVPETAVPLKQAEPAAPIKVDWLGKIVSVWCSRTFEDCPE